MANTPLILVVEDEKAISDILVFNLTREGFQTEAAYDGEEGLNKALSLSPDLVLLDVMLPKMEGWDVLKYIREKSAVPVMMLTAREEEADKVMGLELGADDYVTKPFSMKELIARVRSHIRRSALAAPAQAAPAPVKKDDVMTFGDLKIDTQSYTATKSGKVLDFSSREFSLLLFLAKNPGKVFSRENLMSEVWGYGGFLGDLRAVDVMIRRIREKLETDSSNPEYIKTKRGLGYYFDF